MSSDLGNMLAKSVLKSGFVLTKRVGWGGGVGRHRYIVMTWVHMVDIFADSRKALVGTTGPLVTGTC